RRLFDRTAWHSLLAQCDVARRFKPKPAEFAEAFRCKSAAEIFGPEGCSHIGLRRITSLGRGSRTVTHCFGRPGETRMPVRYASQPPARGPSPCSPAPTPRCRRSTCRSCG